MAGHVEMGEAGAGRVFRLFPAAGPEAGSFRSRFATGVGNWIVHSQVGAD
jgi:hypothetical protein